ncbi:MAG: hypothetical protein ACM3X6_01310 [Patescibacteria group bacterium]
MSDLHEYVGNIHIHTRYSDGTCGVDEIARIGRAAGLDFLLVTDHRTLAARREQGWRDGLLLLAGEELGHRDGHYLGLGLESASQATVPREMVAAVARQGGAGFIAHPDDIRLPWPDWSVSGFDGISLWNFCSQWRGAMRSLAAWLFYPFFPALAVTAPPIETRRRWDALNAAGRGPHLVAAIGSSDAHAFGFRPLGIPLVLVPYRLVFRAINTHVLLPRPLTGRTGEDEASILGALRGGSSFIANHLRGPARGFRFWAQAAGRIWSMGRAVPRIPGLCLEIRLPAKGRIVLLRDGRQAGSVAGDNLSLADPAPGVYRVEVYSDDRRRWGWIFSNPIRVI